MNVDPAVLFALGAMLCWGFGDFLAQRSVRAMGNLHTLCLIGIMELVLLFPFVWAENSLPFLLENIPLVIFFGLCVFVVALLDFEALKQGKLSLVQVIWALELPVSVILGMVFFSESLTLFQWIAIALVFLGVAMVSLRKLSLDLSLLEKGVAIALVAALGMGLVNFLTAAAARGLSVLMAVWAPALVFTPLCLVFLWKRGDAKKLVSNAKSFPLLVLATGITNVFAWVFFALALSAAYLSITVAITESYPVIGVILGVWVNKEHLSKHQWLGAAIALCASVAVGLV
ncbi:MAG: DMT family transporter [archaeon]|nr:DMT family transporter [archaeon]